LGLHLVAQLSLAFGWEQRPGRKHVWARLPSGREESAERRRNQLPEPRSPEIRRD
jgi:hypothetical protein